jgi:hypothetical protein
MLFCEFEELKLLLEPAKLMDFSWYADRFLDLSFTFLDGVIYAVFAPISSVVRWPRFSVLFIFFSDFDETDFLVGL